MYKEDTIYCVLKEIGEYLISIGYINYNPYVEWKVDLKKFVLLGDQFVKHKEELSRLMWSSNVDDSGRWLLEHIAYILDKHNINYEDVLYKLDEKGNADGGKQMYIRLNKKISEIDMPYEEEL